MEQVCDLIWKHKGYTLVRDYFGYKLFHESTGFNLSGVRISEKDAVTLTFFVLSDENTGLPRSLFWSIYNNLDAFNDGLLFLCKLRYTDSKEDNPLLHFFGNEE